MIKSIPFEVIRRDDGRLALSVNAGLIEYEPKSLRLHPQGLMVEGNGPKQRTIIACKEADVLAAFARDKLLRLYEFSRGGLFAAHGLPMVA
jgi:hypothetical protein